LFRLITRQTKDGDGAVALREARGARHNVTWHVRGLRWFFDRPPGAGKSRTLQEGDLPVADLSSTVTPVVVTAGVVPRGQAVR